MAGACLISPNKGKTLHAKFVSSFGRELGTRAFLIGVNPNFKKDYKDSLSLDAEGIPLFDSLLKNKVIRNYIGETSMLEFVNASLGKSKFEDTSSGFHQAITKAMEFNKSSDYRKEYIVYPEVIRDENGSHIVLKANKKTEDQNAKFADVFYSGDYRDRILEKTKELGISESDIEKMASFLNLDMRSVHGLDELISSLSSIKDNPDFGIAYLVAQVFQSEPVVQRTRHFIQAEDMVVRILEEAGYDMEGDITEEDVDAALGMYLLENGFSKPGVAQRASDLIHGNTDTWDFGSLRDAANEAHSGESAYLTTPSEDIIGIEEEISEESLALLEETLDKFTESVDKLKNLEVKKVSIYKSDFTGLRALQNKNVVTGILEYLRTATEELREFKTSFDKLSDMSFQERCSTIKKVLDYSRAYGMIFLEMQEVLFREKSVLNDMEDSEELTSIREALSQILGMNQGILDTAISKASSMFTEFMRPVIGDKIKIDYGKEAGKEITVEELVARSDRDISMVSRWLDSAANSPDTILQGAHLIVKRQKDKARLATIKIMERALAMGKKAEAAGLTDFTFMYETLNGKRTGNYISRYNEGDYLTKREAAREAAEKHNEHADKEDREKNIEKEMREWHKKNSVFTKDGYIPNSLYENKEYTGMTQAQLDFYNEFMEIKSSLDEMLPDDETYKENSIKIRKDLLNRLLSSSNPVKQIAEAAKDALMERSDDTQFGVRTTTDLSGKEVYTVPIYYTRMSKRESAEDLTSDLVGALIAYAYMANNYKAMTEVSAALELGKVAIQKRFVGQHRGNKKVTEIVQGLGKKKKVLEVPKSKSEAEALYNEFMESQVYGIYLKDVGTIGSTKISKNKAASVMLRTGSTIQLGFNFLAGVASAVNGLAMQNIEAAAREFFTAKDLNNADAYYMKHVHKKVGELGSRVKSNELDLIFRLFNVKQDFDKETKDIKFDRKNIILRMFGPSVLYLYQTVGDDFLYGRAALAILMKETVIKDGKEMPLLEALEFTSIGDVDSAGKTISIKGITKKDGTSFTEEDVSRISRKIEFINQKCFGVYNTEDIAAARRTIAGRFLLQYRDWMRPAFNRRFQRTHYNVLLGETREGYYISGIRFTKNLINDLRHGQLSIMKTYRSMSKAERANINRCAFEISQYVAVLALLGLIDWPDDEDTNWAVEMIEYTLRRQKTELGAVIPGFSMITESINIMKSPMANVSVIGSTVDLLKLLYPSTWQREMQSGHYKGHSYGYKIIMDSPVGLWSKNIRRMLDPRDAINYQKQQ